MKIFKAYKFELKPNNKQKLSLMKNAGAARFVWNWGLADRIQKYSSNTENDRHTNAAKQHLELVKLKKTDFTWMYEISSAVPNETLRDLDKAFRNLYRERKRGNTRQGFPKFKKKNKTIPKFRVYGKIKIHGKNHTKYPNKVKLPMQTRMGIKGNCEKLVEKIENGTTRILSANIRRTAYRWFVSFTVEEEFEPYTIKNRKGRAGIDLGLKTFATLSDGTIFESPRPLRKNLRKMKRYDKILSRKQRGSKNFRKQVVKIAKLHYKVKCKRLDYIHKTTHYLVKEYESLVIEKLNVRGMLRNHKLSQSFADLNFGDFRRKIKYKSDWYQVELIMADMFYPSSKKCSKCGHKKTILSLSERIFKCSKCHFTIDRDLNAAINLENYKINDKTVAASETETLNACGEILSNDQLINTISLKQEPSINHS